MGLTESNQSKSGFWAPSKSKSTSQFTEGKLYEAKSRQAATLPARPVSHDRNSPILLSSEKKEERPFTVFRDRPPDRPKHRNRSLQRDPTAWREMRTERSTSEAQSADRKKRQSDPMLDISTSPLSLVPNLKGQGCFSHNKQDKIFSYNNPKGDVSPHPRPTSIYFSEKKCAPNQVSRTSLRRSRRRDSSCSRKECKENFATVNEKETQTSSSTVLFSTSIFEDKNKRSFRTSEKLESTKQLSQDSSHRSKKKTTKPMEKTSCSVPATPNEIESDPYICLYYSNSINRKLHNENKDPHQLKAATSCPPVYSEACLYIPNEVVLPTNQGPGSPVNKRSQIVIKMDNNEVNEVENFEPFKWDSEAIEVCSNVWFESKAKKREKEYVGDDNLNGHSTQQLLIRSKYVKLPSSPIKPYLFPSNEIVDDQEMHCNINERVLQSQVLCHRSSDTEKEDKDLAGRTSRSGKDPCAEQMWSIKQSNSLLKDDKDHQLILNSDFKFNNDNECADEKEKDYNSINTCDVTQATATIKNGPVTFLSLRDTCHAVPEHWLTEDYNDDNGILAENKAIPIPSLAAINPWVRIVECLEEENLVVNPLLNIENGRVTTGQRNHCNTGGSNTVNYVLASPDCTLNMRDFTKSATLPSCSQVSSEHSEWNGDLSDYSKILKRKTIHGLNSGIFPVLRLPKSESQPRLVDVLRRNNTKAKRGQSDCSRTDIGRPSLLHDPLLREPEIGSGVKYSPLDENILYITEDGYEKSGRELMRHHNDAACSDDLQEPNKIISAYAENIPVFTRKAKGEVFSAMKFTDPVRTTKLNWPSYVKPKGVISSADPFYLETLNFSSLKVFGQEGILMERPHDLKSKTFPTGKSHRKKSHNFKKFLSLKLKASPSKPKGSVDCSLTCHEQCQNVVSLDCKAASSDDESLLENNFGVEKVPDEDAALERKESFNAEDTEKNAGETREDKEKEEPEKEEWENNEEDPEEIEQEVKDEEEKHEEEKQEKDIIEELEWSTFRKSEESSTLRRTVYRIQSRAVDSTKIEEWVQKCPLTNVGLQIAKESDGGYRGCLRIHLNLSRPINIVAGTRPPSIYDILQEDRTMEKTLTSFYMPRDAVKAIHITSKTTTREVIVALLRKFKVVDNPHKFALYERTYDTGQSMRAKLRRLSDSECPLVLAIAWNAQGITNKRLVLQENDTADIQWEAFSLPELDNFLRILDREEGEYKNQIKDKYALLRQRIQSQLARIAPVNT